VRFDLGMWDQPEEREAFWAVSRAPARSATGSAASAIGAEDSSRMLISAELIHLNHEPHMLGLALDITERKTCGIGITGERGLLRESEARFSVAFQASPVFNRHSSHERWSVCAGE